MTIKTNLEQFQTCLGRVGDTALPELLTPDIQRRMFRAAGRAIVPTLRRNTPQRTGNTRRAARAKTVESRRDRVRIHKTRGKPTVLKTFYGLVGFRRPEGGAINILEGGTDERFHRNGKSVGRIKPQRILGRAIDSTQQEVRTAMEDGLNRGIKIAVAKGNQTIKRCNLNRVR